MRKAGWVDDNGNATDDGAEVLLNVLLEIHEEKMTELATDFVKESRCESKKEN